MGMLFFLLNTHSIKAYFVLKCNGLRKYQKSEAMNQKPSEPGKSRKIRVLIEEAKQRFWCWKHAFEEADFAVAIHRKRTSEAAIRVLCDVVYSRPCATGAYVRMTGLDNG